MRYIKNIIGRLLLGAVLILSLSGCSITSEQVSEGLNLLDKALTVLEQILDETSQEGQTTGKAVAVSDTLTQLPADFNLEEIPSYNKKPYVEVNGNVPFFSQEDLTEISFEYYSDLDALGRCGVCVASVGKDLMPTGAREEIGSVKPTGWIQKKYAGLVDGNFLYNRCHLLGYQLTGENANKCNLITGTRYMNVDGMLPFENMVADYVKETGNHVLYRVTPIFKGNNLLASGVLMEAESVEDMGEELLYCVYVYNVQPKIKIDYASGDNRLRSTK